MIISLHARIPMCIQTWLVSPIIRLIYYIDSYIQTELSLAFLNRLLYVLIIYFYMVPLREHNLLYLFAICCAMLYLIRRIGPMHFSGASPSQCLPGGRHAWFVHGGGFSAPSIRKKLQTSDKRPNYRLMPLSTSSSYRHAGFRRKESDRYPGPGLVWR